MVKCKVSDWDSAVKKRERALLDNSFGESDFQTESKFVFRASQASATQKTSAIYIIKMLNFINLINLDFPSA